MRETGGGRSLCFVSHWNGTRKRRLTRAPRTPAVERMKGRLLPLRQPPRVLPAQGSCVLTHRGRGFQRRVGRFITTSPHNRGSQPTGAAHVSPEVPVTNASCPRPAAQAAWGTGSHQMTRPQSGAQAHPPTPSLRSPRLTGLLLIAPPTARAALGLPARAANCW